MATQSLQPEQWLIVDNGSDDESPAVIARHRRALAVRVGDQRSERRADQRPRPTDRRGVPRGCSQRSTLRATSSSSSTPTCRSTTTTSSGCCARSPRTIASASRAARATSRTSQGEWRATYTTRDHVRGATRAYRAECFRLVTPLEERMGWDGIDELKAQVARLADGEPPRPPLLPSSASRRPRARLVEVGRPGRHGALHGLPLRVPARTNRLSHGSRAGRGRHGLGLPRRRPPSTRTLRGPAGSRTTFGANRASPRSRSGSARRSADEPPLERRLNRSPAAVSGAPSPKPSQARAPRAPPPRARAGSRRRRRPA